jgi:membrane-bound lytic murein transglycosylase A
MRLLTHILAAVSVLLIALLGCQHIPPEEVTRQTSLRLVDPQDAPSFGDDMDARSLLQSLDKSREYFRRLPQNTTFRFGGDRYSKEHMLASLDRFAAIWRNRADRTSFRKTILAEFNIYESIGSNGRVLFTGYYEPVVKVSRERTNEYRYPIYRRPKNLVTLDLSPFSVKCNKSRVVGRIDGDRFVPFYNRKQIDQQGALYGQGLEIAWADNALDVFFLQIQGSGILQFRTGEYVRVLYDGQNGQSYQSIGKILIEQGKIPKEKMSMPAIRSYLQSHQDELMPILYSNPSYVFFRTAPDGPYGNIGVKLTAGRSVATDYRLFPRGALVYIESSLPLIDWSGNVQSWEEYSRFAMNQDTGGAIRGPGRVDVFWGRGSFAQAAAGNSKAPGKLYFLVLKKGAAPKP